MATVALPISDRVSTSVFLRPMRSPIWAKMTPPMGRIKKVSEKESQERIRPMTGSTIGKKILLNTSAAAVP